MIKSEISKYEAEITTEMKLSKDVKIKLWRNINKLQNNKIKEEAFTLIG